ncbi:MAG: hypothetical protein FJ096_12045 [Deltaproteobacteria bacterium]|nr:hypothetical protein [Deltaproteobacteria bacterium]
MLLRALPFCLLLTACTSADPGASSPPLMVPEGCNPLGADTHEGADCLLPYPSDFYVRRTSDVPRVELPDVALPHDTKGRAVSPTSLHPAAGFSPGSQLLAHFPEGIDASDLVEATSDLGGSLLDTSPTLILAEDGHRILHIAELDPRAKTEDRRALLIRPLERLDDGKRYVVAIRRLRGLDGSTLPPREGFRRLRDREANDEPALASFAGFEDRVLAPLEAAGVKRDELQLAWDFTVRPREDATGDMLAIREAVLNHFASKPASFQVVSVTEAPDEVTARRVELTLDVPLFTEKNEPLSPLRRDAKGRVSAEGTTPVPVTVWIPKSVAERPMDAPPARLLQFGHGFFGMRSEVEDVVLGLANERGFVVMALDWWGMSEADKAPVADELAVNLPGGLAFCDRVHQAMANQLALGESAAALAALPELSIASRPTFAPAASLFYGISMGHILGGTFLGLSPRIERGVLGVGGADFSLMMFRARPFLGFLAFVQLGMPDPLDQQKFAAFAQLEMDRIDPLTYAPHVLAEPLPGSIDARQVLLQIGIGDVAVPNLASHLHARALGVKHLTPAPRNIVGLEAAKGPIEGSALVEFDFGIAPLPGARAQPSVDDTPAHEGVRRSKAGQEQLDRFLRPSGAVEATCDGPCDPE